MTMGEYIKLLRKKHDLTQEELGRKMQPPVNRAAINKWETGQVENIKRSYIEQMSKIFNIRPSELMCFQEPQITASPDADSDVQEFFAVYTKLDTTDRTVIKATADTLLKADKYSIQEKSSSA